MARSLNIVIGADIEKLQKGFNDAVSVVQSSGKKMSEAAAETAKSIQDRLASIATKNPTAGTVRQLTNLAMEARALGPEFAQVSNQIIKEAGRIKDSIGDARAEVGYFASDTRRLDAVLGGVQAVAGAFGAVEGALALSGIESEDLQKTMVKLQGAIALVNGVTAIQTALEQESMFMKGLSTAATELQTFVMGQATIAARVYSAALLATGAGAIIVAIGLVITMFQKSGEAIEEAKVKLAALEKQQERSLTLGQRKIKEEERALDLLISRAQAEGKSEQYIYNLKKASLEKQKGIYQQYGKEALALLDRQRLAELYTVKANSKEATEIRKKYEQLSKDLSYSINQEYQAKVASLQMEADKTTQTSTKKNTDNVKKQKQEILKSAEETTKSEASLIEWLENKRFETGEKAKKKAIEDAKLLTAANLQAGTANTPVYLDVKINPVSYSEAAKDIQKATQALNSAFATLQADAAASFGQFLGDLATGEKEAGKNFGKNMLGAIAAFMDSLGKALIATAVASEAFQKLVLTNPAAAAAAGIALIAGATIVRNSLKEGPKATAFAEGGIVSGPTLGLVGEYPGASSNPEVIAPLDKLKGMLNLNNNSGFVASTTIQGRDLAIVLERYNKDARRG
jgi:hypothetical protein